MYAVKCVVDLFAGFVANCLGYIPTTMQDAR